MGSVGRSSVAKGEKKGYSLFGQPKSRPALTRGEDRIIAGVCSGIAERIDADAVLVRVTACLLYTSRCV